jgi:cobalt-zinc-cadmium efflux system protein
MDAVHNFSDELALVCLALAFLLPAALSKTLQRSANLCNSLGLVLVCGGVVWQACERLRTPGRSRGSCRS